MSKKNILKKRHTRRHTTTFNNSSNKIDISKAMDRHRTSLVRFGRVASGVLARRKWPSFARPFQKSHPQINAARDSPREVMRVVSNSYSYSVDRDRCTRKRRKATPKMHSGLAPSSRVSATTTLNTLLKVCLALGIWHIVRQFDLVPDTVVEVSSSYNDQIRRGETMIAFEKYCNEHLTDNRKSELDVFYNGLKSFRNGCNIQLIFIGDRNLHQLAAYLQKYQKNNKQIQHHYVCYPSDKNNNGTSNDVNTHNNKGMGKYTNILKNMYGIQCLEDFSSSEPITYDTAINFITKSCDELINRCGTQKSRVFHIGSMDDAKYFTAESWKNKLEQLPNHEESIATRVRCYFADLPNNVEIVN